MPVIEGVFVPRSPLTPAELHVDFLGHNTHILDQRARIEADAAAAALRIADGLHLLRFGSPGALTDHLAARLTAGLDRTARYGFREAQRELAAARAGRPVVAAVRPIPDAGQFATVALQGIEGVLAFVRRRGAEAARNVTDAVQRVFQIETDPVRALVTARDIARRTLHNNVLDLVGETLNLGRTAGALALPVPPTFGLRSEQLDKNTCAPCDGLHGTITQVGSPQFFATLPPVGCLGGGRCRGLEVFADGPRDVRQPHLQAA